MKLSEAMMLGSVTVEMRAADMNSCGLGAACNALGVPLHKRYGDASLFNRYTFMEKEWPWLKLRSFYRLEGWSVDGIEAIWTRFDNEVVHGRMTLEQLVDYVASIEPACGECNRFTCTCKPVEEVHDEQLSACRGDR